MISVIWSPQAIRDIESIRAFITQDSPSYADLEARRVVAAIERLRAFPESGRLVPERQDPTIREVITSPYRIVYRLRGGIVEVATIFEPPVSSQISFDSGPTSACSRPRMV